MTGLYIHIPFCSKACHYCDFHFSTSLHQKKAVLDAICKELVYKSYETQAPLRTIYLGGGTPSLLNLTELKKLFDTIHLHFDTSHVEEVTLEANPEDITKERLEAWLAVGIDRLSIGIQSLHDEVLLKMNRSHNASEAITKTLLASKMGFKNISVDYIFGHPFPRTIALAQELNTLLYLPIEHISIYNFTIEKKTVFGHQYSKGLLHPMPDDISASEYKEIMDLMYQSGFEHYEISNFCRQGYESKHNSAYWQDIDYIGVGPSAHSYSKAKSIRSWNIANNALYVKFINGTQTYFEQEILTPKDKFNELILTGLRTKWGIPLEKLFFLNSNHKMQFYNKMEEYSKQNLLELTSNSILLTHAGKPLADYITSSFFVTD